MILKLQDIKKITPVLVYYLGICGRMKGSWVGVFRGCPGNSD